MPDEPQVTVYVDMPVTDLNTLIAHQRRSGQSTAMGIAVRAAAVERARQLRSEDTRAEFMAQRSKPKRGKPE